MVLIILSNGLSGEEMKEINRVVLILLVFSLIGCSSKLVSGSLIHKEQTGPIGPEVGERAIEIAYTAEEYDALWEYFNFNKSRPEIDFDEAAIIFAHTMESSCPIEIDKVEFGDDGTALYIETVQKGSTCATIGIPKTFVILIEKVKLETLEKVYFEGKPFDHKF